jgi:hypothetical protein
MNNIYKSPKAELVCVNLKDIITTSYEEDDLSEINAIDVMDMF